MKCLRRRGFLSSAYRTEAEQAEHLLRYSKSGTRNITLCLLVLFRHFVRIHHFHRVV